MVLQSADDMRWPRVFEVGNPDEVLLCKCRLSWGGGGGRELLFWAFGNGFQPHRELRVTGGRGLVGLGTACWFARALLFHAHGCVPTANLKINRKW